MQGAHANFSIQQDNTSSGDSTCVRDTLQMQELSVRLSVAMTSVLFGLASSCYKQAITQYESGSFERCADRLCQALNAVSQAMGAANGSYSSGANQSTACKISKTTAVQCGSQLKAMHKLAGDIMSMMA